MRDAFTSLRRLGFRETDVRPLLDAVLPELPAEATIEQTVRLALKRAPMPSCVREEHRADGLDEPAGDGFALIGPRAG